MTCIADASERDDGFFPRLLRKAEAANVPISGTFDLTWRCCFRCPHCYAGPARSRQGEVSTGEALRLIDEMAAAGCLDLLFSGGDPLVRRDFPEVYRRAREHGLFVKVFTNAARVSDRIAALFAELPPDFVEVTLYAATDETARRITGDPSGLGRTLRGIQRLRERGVRVRLKSVLMTLNRAEFPAIEARARSMGLPFRMDPAILPRLDGDRAPLALRVPAEEAIRLEFADDARRRRWTRYRDLVRSLPATDALYTCKAGRTDFHLDPYGRVRPCVMFPDAAFDARTLGFLEAWRRASASAKKRKISVDRGFGICDKLSLSGTCGAVAHLETGSEHGCSEYLGALGRERKQRIEQSEATGGRAHHEEGTEGEVREAAREVR